MSIPQILIWAIILTAGCGLLVFSIKKKFFAAVVFNAVFIIFVYEISVIFLLRNPELLRKAPAGIVEHMRSIYNGIDIRVIQADNNQIRYDSEVTYTLRPGTFIAKNREFENQYFVNSQGLRDDEASLDAPEIIVLGDSHAMGWGIHQNESFPELIEKETGITVLNTAISSYASVRQMRMLSRLDLTNLKTLIIQYSSNDKEENLEFFNNRQLEITSEAEYRQHMAQYRKNIRYYPGKYAVTNVRRLLILINQMAKNLSMKKPDVPKDDIPKQAKAFLNAILNAGDVNLNGVQIIAFMINNHHQSDPNFFNALEKEIQDPKYPRYIRNMVLIDPALKLNSEHGFVLDVHLNAKGHRVIADEILKVID